jgi:hypothetical protein
MITKIVATCRPRNPRFKDVHTGTKRRLDVKTSNRISGSGNMRIYDAMFWFLYCACSPACDVLVFMRCDVLGFLGCYYLLQQLCKMITKDSSNMCWVFRDAMIFCNNFARWLQKIVATVMWCVRFSGMLLSFVTTLPDDYNDSSNCDVMCWVSGMLWSFVTTLQDDYKR